jgi:hypothetical protein
MPITSLQNSEPNIKVYFSIFCRTSMLEGKCATQHRIPPYKAKIIIWNLRIQNPKEESGEKSWAQIEKT